MIAPRACLVCGEDFVPRRKSTAYLCSPACKQTSYRKRLREARVTDSPPSRLTFELRAYLRAEISRRRIAALDEGDRERGERLLALFSNERPVT